MTERSDLFIIRLVQLRGRDEEATIGELMELLREAEQAILGLEAIVNSHDKRLYLKRIRTIRGGKQ